MAFEVEEESRSLGEPQALYRFTVGANTYAYTDWEDIITFQSDDYQPIPIDRTSVNTSGTLDKSTLTVRVPHNTAIAELFRVFPPSEVVGLTIFQGHADDESGEYLAIWVGRVLSCKREGSEAALACEPVSTSMKRPGLRVRDQYQCPHALYGPSCRADRDENTVAATVASVAGAVVTLEAGWNGSFAASRFTNGIIQWGTDQRQILSVAGTVNQLRVGGVLTGLEAGTTVSLSLGCNHETTDCNKFDNIQNYGGCKWIPLKNPIGFVNQFY